MNFEEQVRAAGFPDGVQVTREEGLGDVIFRARQGDRGAELRLTAEAQRMYGVGPATAAALTQLRQVVEADLPQLRGGEFEQLVFLGD